MGANLRDDFFLSTGPYKTFGLWVEGLTWGDVTLELTFQKGSDSWTDRVKLNLYQLAEIRYKTFIACDAVETGINPVVFDYHAGDNRWFGYT